MTDQNNQVTTTTSPRKDIRDFIDAMKPQFALALPKLVTPERFVRIALTCVNKKPALLTCTRDSLLACLLDCAQLGIEPDGRRAHLIPFRDNRKNVTVCTLIIDYKGLAELVMRSGEVSSLHADVVYPRDTFDYQFGTDQFLRHKPALDRGDEKPIACYSFVKLKDGQTTFDVMGVEAIERIRRRSRSANEGPWVTDWDEMGKKTVFRRHAKWLPLSPELRDKIEKDDERLTEQERFAAAKTVPATAIQFDTPEATEPEPQAQPEPEPVETTTTTTPAGDTINVHRHPETAQDPLPKPKRTRRTKAQIAADEEAAAKAADSARAAQMSALSPVGHLRLLISGSPIKEEEYVRHLITTMRIEPRDTLDTLDESKLVELQMSFMADSTAIVEGQNKAPY